MLKKVFLFFFYFYHTLSFSQVNHWESVILKGDEFKYLLPTVQPPTSWIDLSFEDINWSVGESGFGYGDSNDSTLLPNGTLVVLIRKKFKIFDKNQIEELYLYLDYDDGFVAYLNGIEIARDLVNGQTPGFDQPASGFHEAQFYQEVIPSAFSIDPNLLQNGDNILAITVHNENSISSDLSAIPHLFVGISNQNRTYRDIPAWFNRTASFTETTLPIVVINTNGQQIVNDPKISASIGIINNGDGAVNHLGDSFNEYEGKIGIEVRGESSQWFEKKSYGFEMWDDLGNDFDTGFLDFPSEEDFILYGPYSDKSLINNRLAMKLANEMGHYASRTRFVELFINENYEGIYVLMERIKRDKNRINISKLEPKDVSGDKLTGGYIIRIDKGSYDGWSSKFPSLLGQTLFFQFYYPDQETIIAEQKEYIQLFIDDFENAIASPTFRNEKGKHYTEYINLRSFIDNFIINELSKNVDAYRLSTYLYKDRDSKGGKLICGYWDFNLSFGNADYCSGDITSGWEYYQCDHGPNPFWWDKMLQDTLFVNALQCRWSELRSTTLHIDSIFQDIDGFVAEIETAQQRNFDRWQIMGSYVWPNPWFYANASSHNEVIENMKEWIRNRTIWLDQNMPGLARHCEVYENIDYPLGLNRTPLNFNMYPNPSKDWIYINNSEKINHISFTNITGQVIYSDKFNSFSLSISVATIPRGLYFVTVYTHSGMSTHRLMVE